MAERFRFPRPSKDWTAADRLPVVQAAIELIERDVNRGVYGREGRPNFMSVYHLLNEPPDVLEAFRDSCESMLLDAERERGG